MSIAEQMGVALQNTASSVNIKERLDFSCAIFDAEARLVANAPHMPVHLGSMDRSVEAIIAAQCRAHQAGRRLCAQCALCRRHASARHHRLHAVVRQERAQDSVLGRRARPSCRYRRHIAGLDVAARDEHRRRRRLYRQFQARRARPFSRDGNRRAARRRRPIRRATSPRTSPISRRRSPPTPRARHSSSKMIADYSARWSRAYMRHVQDNAAESVARVIASLHDAEFACEMDQGTWIRVAISVDRARREATSSIFPAPARSRPAISTRRSRSHAPPSCMSSGSWSKTRYR